MRSFVSWSLIYAVTVLALMSFRYPDFSALSTDALKVAVTYEYILKSILVRFSPIFVLLAFIVLYRRSVDQIFAALYALIGCIALQIGFSLSKSAIPAIVPFYADTGLAWLDRLLHGGNDPWSIAHAALAPSTALSVLPAYLEVWAGVAFGLPAIVAISDSNETRVNRYVALYLGVWIGLGNILALAGSSVGPVFYDRLLGGDRFADLTLVLQNSGITSTMVGRLQNYLWTSYEAGALLFGSGISAFPSVHLGIATLTALYLYERWCILIVPGLVYVVLVQFLSVYTGYHYAFDGYVSVMLVTVAWMWLRRREARSTESSRSAIE